MQLQVVERLRVVRAPVLYKVGQHSRIKAAASACTALEHDVRMCLNDSVHDPVKTEHIAV